MVAFGIALLSLSGWISWGMWFLSLIGVLVALIALRRIAHSDPPMLGRKLALAALFVSLVCAVGVAVEWHAYRLLIRQEAREFAEYWIDLQRQGDSTKAARLVRQPVIADGMANLTKTERAETALKVYCNRPEVRALLALGGQAQIRYYDTESQEHDGTSDSVKQVFAVTYTKEGKKTTFFLRLEMERKVPSDKPVGVWVITSTESGIKPVALGGESKT
jgi:hypothetical protein